MNTPGQLLRGTPFGDAIFNICSQPHLNIFVESGTWNGLGSTKILLEATAHNPLAQIISVEANREMYNIAMKNHSPCPERLVLKCGKLSQVMMTEGQIKAHPRFFPIRAHFDLHYKQDCIDFARAPLVQLPRYCDVGLLDGGEFSSVGDLDRILSLRPKIIILDDTLVMKNCDNLERLLRSGEWSIIATGKDKTGWAILERRSSATADFVGSYTQAGF